MASVWAALVLSFTGGVLLYRTRRDTHWSDVWACLTLAPLVFVMIVTALS
jgi:hypothetical protein